MSFQRLNSDIFRESSLHSKCDNIALIYAPFLLVCWKANKKITKQRRVRSKQRKKERFQKFHFSCNLDLWTDDNNLRAVVCYRVSYSITLSLS